MEDLLDTNTSNEPKISTATKQFLLETTKWGRFLAIVSFVMLGLMTLGTIFSVFLGVGAVGVISGVTAQGSLVVVVYLLVALLYFFPTYYLYKFSTKLKAGLLESIQSDVDSGFENLKSMFKFMGILMIIVLSFYALAFLMGLIGMLTGA